MKHSVTAMDLGTSTTCICTCVNDTVHVLRPEPYQSDHLGGAVPTLVLYRDGALLTIGAQAELEYLEAGLRERQHYALHGQFKPDIAVSEDARQHMQDFLTLLRAKVPTEDWLLVGVPCQAGNHYRQMLQQCLNDSGFANARFLDEPVGAVIHCIASGVLSPSRASRGVLTVDFGGGTCDLAVLRKGMVVTRSGDMLYGGRLFDDLFYQMLLLRNPHLFDQLQQEGNTDYVHWVACRQTKEEFSNAVRANRAVSHTVRVRWSYYTGGRVVERAAYIKDLRWADFLIRAGAYVASEALRARLAGHALSVELSPEAQGLREGKRVDLISWFENLLLRELKDIQLEALAHGGDKAVLDIPQVLLTGGSSCWPFVEDIVRKVMGDKVQVLLGDEPYADIARGLAQYPLLKERLHRGRMALEEELPQFIRSRIEEQAIHQTLQAGTAQIMQELQEMLRAHVLTPEFVRYREDGGSLRTLMENIASAMQRHEANIRAFLSDELHQLGRRIGASCREELQHWFRGKGITIMPERLEKGWITVSMDRFLHRIADKLMAGTFAQEKEMAELATTVIGPSLAAFIAAHLPLAGGILPVLVVGIGGAVLMKKMGWSSWLVEQCLKLPVLGMVRRRLFSDERLQALCDDQLTLMRNSFCDLVLEEWGRERDGVTSEVRRIIEEEIAALDILNTSPA